MTTVSIPLADSSSDPNAAPAAGSLIQRTLSVPQATLCDVQDNASLVDTTIHIDASNNHNNNEDSMDNDIPTAIATPVRGRSGAINTSNRGGRAPGTPLCGLIFALLVIVAIAVVALVSEMNTNSTAGSDDRSEYVDGRDGNDRYIVSPPQWSTTATTFQPTVIGTPTVFPTYPPHIGHL